jgi:hypothetical protein
MAESSSSSNNFLYFIVGALVVAVGVFAYFYFEFRYQRQGRYPEGFDLQLSGCHVD